MIRIWPWTKFAELEKRIAFHRERAEALSHSLEIRQTIALHAMRDVAAANKGIRRLKEKLKKKEAQP
jgi:hypothetical protein